MQGARLRLSLKEEVPAAKNSTDSDKKMLLIGGGVLAAAGAIYLLTRPKASAAQSFATSPAAPLAQSAAYAGGSLTPSQVQCVQQALASAGFPPKGGADGQWGANTSASLAAYMKARGVASDGTFNADAAASPLGACLRAAAPSQPSAPSTPSQTSAPSPSTTSPQTVDAIRLTTYPGTIYASCTNGQTDTATDKTIRDWLYNDCHFNNLMTVATELRTQGCTELSDYAIQLYSEILTDT